MKSAIALMAGEGTTSSQKLSTQSTSNLKDLVPQEDRTKEQGREKNERPPSSKKSQKSSHASKGKRSTPLEVTDNEKPQKRQKIDAPPNSLQLAIFNPNSSIVEANENKALALLETKKVYYPFGCESIFSIDVMNCFPAPSHYVYRRLNNDWVKILTLDLIEDAKFEEILGIVMPFDNNLKVPLQTFTKENISSATYWIISGQHSISAAKRLQKSNLPRVTT